MLSGIVTAVQLLLFNAAKRLRYSTLGFLQYITPSIQFLLAIFVFREHLTLSRGIAFAAIWTALAILVAEVCATAAPRAANGRRRGFDFASVTVDAPCRALTIC